MGEKFGAGGWKGSYKKTRERGRERENKFRGKSEVLGINQYMLSINARLF